MTTYEPKAWVGCLSCYNSGHLVGEWVQGTEAGDTVADATWALAVHEGIAMDEPISMHEEWWVFDFEGYGKFLTDECSPFEAQRIAELIDQITSTGYDVAAVAAWAEIAGTTISEWDAPTRMEFEDAYTGEYQSMTDYAHEWLEETGALAGMPEDLQRYFDYESYAQDLDDELYTAPADDGHIYVFSI